MEIITPAQYGEYDAFVASHPQSSFTQCTDWRKVKNNWGYEAVISRSASGEIVGAMGVLIQKIPMIGTSFLYAPRGPVCDLHNKAILLDLKTAPMNWPAGTMPTPSSGTRISSSPTPRQWRT